MKPFDHYLRQGDVHKVNPDRNLSRALLHDAFSRLRFAKKDAISDEDAKFILENAYEAAREAADALLVQQGYKSCSHEATLAFLQRCPEIPEEELFTFDRLRRQRNDSKYLGKTVDADTAQQALAFCERIVQIMEKLLRQAPER